MEIVRELLRVGPGACVARSKDGKVPLHLAIMKVTSRVEVVSELTRACHESTRLKLDRGETIYHLCVKYDNLEALQMLVEELMGENENDGNNDLLNARDDDGNTILHLAAIHKHLQIIKYLLTRPGIELNTVNNSGLTALDLVENSPRDLKGLELLNFLLQSNAQRGVDQHSSFPTKQIPTSIPRPRSRTKSWKSFFTFSKTTTNQLEEMRGGLFVTAAIIVAVTVLPLIYIEVHDSSSNLVGDFSTTTISLWSALILMITLLSGFPLSNELCAWFVVQLMYTAIGFLGLYFISSMVSNENQYVNVNGPIILMFIWFVLIMLVTLLNLIRIVSWLVKIIKGCVKRRKMQARRQNVLSNVA